ncbi:ATP-binding protein [Altericista sp. CCNU0014]|uniref:ATP-binding protein n=1 Tax=Altericista sp. CCNU0014 TaxID=3082949 RepID=UPI00384EC512
MQPPSPSTDWYQENQTALIEAIAYIRECLQSPVDVSPALPSVYPPTLVALCNCFNLSPFERDTLLLCAGMELESDIASLCGTAQGNPLRPYPTFSLALTVLPEADWVALLPTAPLRHWRLIELGEGNALTDSPLRIDEQILHYLTGNYHLNEQLKDTGAVAVAPAILVPSHQQLAEKLAQAWSVARSEPETDLLPILQLCGPDPASQRAIAQAACAQLTLTPYAIATELLPPDQTSLNLVKRLWEREYYLSGAALLLEWDDRSVREAKQGGAIAAFVDSIRVPIFLLSAQRCRQRNRTLLAFDVVSPTTEEQRHLWESALNPIAPDLNGHVEHLVSHFNFTAPAIRTASLKLRSQAGSPALPNSAITAQIWQICRMQARPRLDELAQRMDSTATWQDLVLPDPERQVLRDLATQLKQRTKVYEQWGFGGSSKRGLGISALFAGASGTGKTLAAEVLAQEIRLDLYRIDLSAVVSKYIGETEKNLGRVFDAAEVGGTILLFDEADALFGRRSEVKDSHDRYANMEVSYLLQRMESYRGLAVLTTNFKGAIDQAFLRRIRFIVQFPFPDASQRAEIWQRVFPKQAPTRDLEPSKLARLNIAGGNIRNIALNAAFIAAEANEPIQMTHILQAARSEYTKLERPLTDAEVKGWI